MGSTLKSPTIKQGCPRATTSNSPRTASNNCSVTASCSASVSAPTHQCARRSRQKFFCCCCCCFGECIMLSQPQPFPAQEQKPHHPDAHAVPWHQHDTDRKDPVPSVSSKHVIQYPQRLNPQNTISYEVCRSFSVQSDPFNASTRPTNPVTSITTFKARHNYRSPMVHPYNTNFITPLSNRACSMTISRKAPSGNPSSKLTRNSTEEAEYPPRELQRT